MGRHLLQPQDQEVLPVCHWCCRFCSCDHVYAFPAVPPTCRFSTDAAAAAAAKGKPLAVSLMLERLWAVYDAAQLNVSVCVMSPPYNTRHSTLCRSLQPDDARLLKIVSALGLESSIPKRDLAAKDGKARLQVRSTMMRGTCRDTLP